MTRPFVGTETASGWADWDATNATVTGDGAVRVAADALPTWAAPDPLDLDLPDGRAVVDLGVEPCGDAILLLDDGSLHRHDRTGGRTARLDCGDAAVERPRAVAVADDTIYVAGGAREDGTGGRVVALARRLLHVRWRASEAVADPVALAAHGADVHLLDAGGEGEDGHLALLRRRAPVTTLESGIAAPSDLAVDHEGARYVLAAVGEGEARGTGVVRFGRLERRDAAGERASADDATSDDDDATSDDDDATSDDDDTTGDDAPGDDGGATDDDSDATGDDGDTTDDVADDGDATGDDAADDDEPRGGGPRDDDPPRDATSVEPADEPAVLVDPDGFAVTGTGEPFAPAALAADRPGELLFGVDHGDDLPRPLFRRRPGSGRVERLDGFEGQVSVLHLARRDGAGGDRRGGRADGADLGGTGPDAGGDGRAGANRSGDRYASDDGRRRADADADPRSRSGPATRDAAALFAVAPAGSDVTALSPRRPNRRNPRTGRYDGQVVARLDSGVEGCEWHRVTVDADSRAAGTQVRLRYFATDDASVERDEALGVEAVDGIGEVLGQRLRDDGVDLLTDLVGLDPAEVVAYASAGHYTISQETAADWLAEARRRLAESGGVEWTRLDVPDVSDALVDDARGRYLWLRLDVVGDRFASPRLERVRGYFPRESYLRYLPGIFREDRQAAGFLERFLSTFESVLDDVGERREAAVRYFDAVGVPDDALDWLEGWLALEPDGAWSTAARRERLRRAPDLFRARGTRAGLLATADLFLEGRPDPPTHWQWARARQREWAAGGAGAGAASPDDGDGADGDGADGEDTDGADDRPDDGDDDRPSDGAGADGAAEDGTADRAAPQDRSADGAGRPLRVLEYGDLDCVEREPARRAYERIVPCSRCFAVLLWPELSAADARGVERILARQQPAHATGRTVRLQPWLQLSGRADGDQLAGADGDRAARADGEQPANADGEMVHADEGQPAGADGDRSARADEERSGGTERAAGDDAPARSHHTLLGVNSVLVDREYVLEDAALGKDAQLTEREADGALGPRSRLGTDTRLS